MKNCFSKEATNNETRLARTPPSTFLFLPIQFSNNTAREGPAKLRAPENHRVLFHYSSEEL